MSRLNEQEQRAIIRYLKATKPLPKKCRILLFEDTGEVDLAGNGKAHNDTLTFVKVTL